MNVGCHLSIRNGFTYAARTALKINASCYQYFPKNPRRLTVKQFQKQDTEQCRFICHEHGLQTVAHSPYPTNLGSTDPNMREMIVRSVVNDLQIAEACGSIGTIVHFGHFREKNALSGYETIIENINEIMYQYEGDAYLLIENQAGAGQQPGTTFEELAQIRHLSDQPDRIGFCLDTCHLFVSGVWDGTNWQQLVQNGEGLGFFDHLKVIHLNDSRYPYRSRKDRHAKIGDGYIGITSFRTLIHSSIMSDQTFILETPATSITDKQEQINNIQRVFGQ